MADTSLRDSADAAARAWQSEVFEQAPVAIAVLRGRAPGDLVFEIANPRYLEMLPAGSAPLGRRLQDALPEVADAMSPLLQRVLDTGEPLVASDYCVPLDRDGDGVPEGYYFNFVYHPLKQADGAVMGIVGIGTEVTESVRARRDAERARDRADRLQALTAALAATTTPEEVAEVVVARGVAATGAATGMLAVREREGEHAAGARILRHEGLTESVHAEYAHFPLDGPGPAAMCLRTGEPIFLESGEAVLAHFPALPHVWKELGTRALATVPLAVGSQTIGAMSFTWTAPRAFTTDDRQFFLALGRQAAQALERARLFAAERDFAAERASMEARLRFAMEAAELGAWDLDVATGRAWRSLRHDEIFGYPGGRGEWTYADFLAHVHPDDRAMVGERFGGALAEGTPWDFTCRIRRANDGAERWISARGEPAGREAGRATRLVGVVRDVTEQQLTEQALRETRDAAEAANRAKSEFLAIMSHELRTPLNAIGGYAELIEMGIRGPVTLQQVEDLRRIQASQRHLLGLVNEVLNYARIETGSVRYDLADTPIAGVLASVEPLVAPQLAAKGLAFEVTACDARLVARADREKVRQVLLNLLSNAIKFTDPGGRVTMWCEERGGVVAIHVADTGIGIAPEELGRVFEPFVQVNASLTRTHEGTGLGLAISRDLARGMGGELTAESTPGAGSTFTLTLPRA